MLLGWKDNGKTIKVNMRNVNAARHCERNVSACAGAGEVVCVFWGFLDRAAESGAARVGHHAIVVPIVNKLRPL